MKPSEIGRLARERIDVPWDEVRAARVQRAVVMGGAQGPARTPLAPRGVRGRRIAVLVAVAACLGMATVGAWRARPGSRLDFADGSVIVPEPGGRVVTTSVSPERIEVEQVSGDASYDVVPRPGRRFVVRAGAVSVAVLGTAFRIERHQGTVHVRVDRGRVEVSRGDRTMVLGAAEEVSLADDTAPVPRDPQGASVPAPRPGPRPPAEADPRPPEPASPSHATPVEPSAGRVTFVNGKATGPMVGFGWISGGAGLAVTSPACRGGAFTFAGGAGCGKTEWSSKTELCMTGSNTAVCKGGGSACDSAHNWGAQIGVDVSSPKGRPLGGTYRSIALTFTGEPPNGARLQVKDDQGHAYCVDGYPSGAAVTAEDLVTSCWSTTDAGTPLRSLSAVVDVELRIPSGKTAATIPNVCLTGIDLR